MNDTLPQDLDEELMKLSSIDDVKKFYNNICEEEVKNKEELENLLSHHVQVKEKMTTLVRSLPKLDGVGEDVQRLSELITFTSDLAETISGKVKQLDLAKSRASECMHRVEDILDLKFCTDGVQKALENEDYEKAAAHVHRFLSLDQIGLRKSALDTNEDSNLEEAFSKLHEAESRLAEIVTAKFDEAARDEDLASVERFFKIFPLLNMHTQGLNKFGAYLCAQVADLSLKNLQKAQSTAPNSKRANIAYADCLTLLVEGIARVIEVQKPLVETYYGPGKLLTLVEMLQNECDRQIKKILEEFKSHRQFHKKTLEIQHSNSSKAVDKLDPRDLDALLAEITLFIASAELYIRFIRKHVMMDIEIACPDKESARSLVQKLEYLIKNSYLSHSMQEFLGVYILMEEYFLRESINKAIQMDSVEEKALTSTMLDDVFFIIKKCLGRCLNSGSVDGMCAMINHTCTLLQSTFCEALSERLKHNVPSTFLDLGMLQSSVPSTADHTLYLVAMNNADVACEHVETLARALEAQLEKAFVHASDSEKAKLKSCLSDLRDCRNKFQGVRGAGMVQLCQSAVRPRVKPWADSLQAASHHLMEDDFAQLEATDGLRPFMQSFIRNLDSLLKSFKEQLTVQNYDTLVVMIVTELTELLEKAVFKSSFNRLGGLQFDRELRALVAYLTSVTTWSIRDRFTRLNQIATLLNLETLSELTELWGPNTSGPVTWRLGPGEVRQVLYLRSDFKMEEIKRLKL